MTDTTTPAAAPEATPAAEPAAPAPRSDAEAAERETQAPEPKAESKEPEPKKDAAAEKERQRNRTREYIQKLNREAAELREELARLKQSKSQTPEPARTPEPQAGEPKLEDFDFDYTAYQRAHSAWAVEQALSKREESTRQTQEDAKRRDTAAAYAAKAVEFADDHPDFFEVINAMDVKLLTPELQFAIMGQDNGPEIAYHLATHEDDLWNLASIRADLLPAAVSRLASRLSAAPPTPTPDPVSTPDPKPLPPVSKAPAPVPAVAGRAPTETPPEKLTDDEWFRRERDRSRKR